MKMITINKLYINRVIEGDVRRYIILLILLILPYVFSTAQVKNNQKEMDIFISNLIKKMTLEEKLGQLNLITPFVKTGPFANKKAVDKLKDGSAGNVYSLIGSLSSIRNKLGLVDSTRLKIPMLSGSDIIHGFKTVFPIPLGLSCTWDTLLIEKTARVAAIEATAMGHNWVFSPMVDLTRDPRWGRVVEGSGEDPYLGSIIARAMVKGYQGSNLSDSTSLMSCVKHFGVYGAAEAGRDYNVTDMSRLTMFQNYLPPYWSAIKAGAGSIMTSFNEIDGVPSTANKWLLTDILRKSWGFNGLVVTDFNAIQELELHGVASDLQQAAELALNAGVDMDMASEAYISSLKKVLDEKKITISQIDKACRRVLEAKYKLGLFDKSKRITSQERITNSILTDKNLALSKEAALKSIVLLENKNSILPLQKNCKIALIGPFANSQSEMFSSWVLGGEVKMVTTILDGLKKTNPNIMYAQGTQVSSDTIMNRKLKLKYDPIVQRKLMAEAIDLASKSDVIIAVLGESINMSGESSSRADINIPICQRELLGALKQTGKPVVLVLVNGRPLTIQDDLLNTDAVIESWRLGTKAGEALSDVIFGDYNPSGKLTMTFPRSIGQIPIYYNCKNTGRPYIPGQLEEFVSNYKDQQNTPLYPFGYGLSYTSFKYGDIILNDKILNGNNANLKIEIDVTNIGKSAGEETAQLYLRDMVASVTRPVKELKKYKKVYLLPGETQKISFDITPEDLKFYNSDFKWDWESGTFEIYIGTNSRDVNKNKFVWNK
jgi:beta-glucosidase